MSHFAKINSSNIVTEVIVAEQNFINSGAVGDSFLWIQTSYNENFRGKFAGVGDTWDKVNEVFIPPQPFTSWTLDENTYQWVCPLTHPDDDKMYTWDEDIYQADNTKGWVTNE